MLKKCLYAEQMKLKRNPVWLAFFILPMISAGIGTLNFLGNQGILDMSWYDLWSQHTLFLCFFFMPTLIGTYCACLWRNEYLHNNMNMVFSMPIRRSTVYLAKLITVAMVTLISILWILFLFFACGKISGITEPFPMVCFEWVACGFVGSLTVCGLQLLLSLLIRKFAVPIGLGFAGGILGLVALSKGYAMYYPYSLFSLGIRANNPYMEINIPMFLLSCFLFTVSFYLIAALILSKRDIKS